MAQCSECRSTPCACDFGWFLASSFEDSAAAPYLVHGPMEGASVRNHAGGFFRGASGTAEGALQDARSRLRQRLEAMDARYFAERRKVLDELAALDALDVGGVRVIEVRP